MAPRRSSAQGTRILASQSSSSFSGTDLCADVCCGPAPSSGLSAPLSGPAAAASVPPTSEHREAQAPHEAAQVTRAKLGFTPDILPPACSLPVWPLFGRVSTWGADVNLKNPLIFLSSPCTLQTYTIMYVSYSSIKSEIIFLRLHMWVQSDVSFAEVTLANNLM